MLLAEPPVLPRILHVDLVAKLVTEMPDAKAPPVDRRIQTKADHSVDVGIDYDPQYDEVPVNTTAMNIDALTEAWATVNMPAGIDPNQCGSL